MPPGKPKNKERLKVGLRVQLKKDLVTDGSICAKNAGNGQWKVNWTEGSLKGTITDQSSKSLRPWRLNLAEAAADESSSDEDDEDDEDLADAPVDHAGNKRRFEAHAKSLVGKKVEVSRRYDSPLAASRSFLQVKDKTHGTITWEYVPNGSCKKDDFPNVAGPRGVPDVKRPQVEVIKNFKYKGASGDLLRAWLRLLPGGIEKCVSDVDAAVRRTDSKAAAVTAGELVVWEGLFLAATLVPQRGDDLFTPPSKPRRFVPHPGFQETPAATAQALRLANGANGL